jgi:hypothetical protein
MFIMALALCPDAHAASPAPAEKPAHSSASLRFDKVFSDQGEPRAIHYKVDFWRGAEVHHLELWRDAGQLTRRTDDAVQTHARRQGAGPEFEMAVLDLKKKIITTVGRTNLYRIGDFTEWFDLAHGLKFPKADYTLKTASAPPQVSIKPLEACRWYALTQAGRTTLVCWSDSARVPLQLASAEGQLLWNVTFLQRRVPDAEVFKIKDEGFIRNDANQDIDRD